MLVPENVAHPPGTDERMPTPGAETSGLRRSESVEGPADEKLSIWSSAPLARVVTAPTVIAFAVVPGDQTLPRPNSL